MRILRRLKCESRHLLAAPPRLQSLLGCHAHQACKSRQIETIMARKQSPHGKRIAVAAREYMAIQRDDCRLNRTCAQWETSKVTMSVSPNEPPPPAYLSVVLNVMSPTRRDGSYRTSPPAIFLCTTVFGSCFSISEII